MLQPDVFFKDYSDNRSLKEGEFTLSSPEKSNSTLFAEGEGVTATSLGQRPSGGGIFIKSQTGRIIHRVPSVEGATATSLGSLKLIKFIKKINMKNAPDELSLCNNHNTMRLACGA